MEKKKKTDKKKRVKLVLNDNVRFGEIFLDKRYTMLEGVMAKNVTSKRLAKAMSRGAVDIETAEDTE